tara:strand:+ start:2196 stop:2381 length:186 start_codon:yes stop_codon:yes gene_type:complete
MRRFKSISVKPETYDLIKVMSERLLPKVKLSNSQVIESAIRNCSHDEIQLENNETRIQKKV